MSSSRDGRDEGALSRQPPLVDLRGITKHFPGVVANHRVDLTVRAGEVHGLLGENGAGKTTLMNILYGLYEPDEGHIEIKGRRVDLRSPRQAVELGIGMLHQHFMLIPDMTVAENVALGLGSDRYPFTRMRRVIARIVDLSDRYGLRVEPDAYVGDLSVGARQRVEILKLLYRGADILILDEPTSVLRPQEWQQLAAVLRSLTSEGRATIFITHKLDELFEVADRSTVLRDGEVVGTVSMAASDKQSLARLMVGREVVLRVPRVRANPGEPLLEVEGMSLVDAQGNPLLVDLSFQLRSGEILGVAGVDGNGQQELVEAVTGVRGITSGSIRMAGCREVQLAPEAFFNCGGAVIPEDRHSAGVALDLSLLENLMLREFRDERFCRRGVLDGRAMEEHCSRLVEEFGIRAPSLRVRLRQLSGGNQQRTVVARELHRNPRILVAAQPTRGLDVGAMEYVYAKLLAHKRGGGAVLLISSELDEILSLSDRIAVMMGGSFRHILDANEADAETLGLLMGGGEIGPALPSPPQGGDQNPA